MSVVVGEGLEVSNGVGEEDLQREDQEQSQLIRVDGALSLPE